MDTKETFETKNNDRQLSYMAFEGSVCNPENYKKLVQIRPLLDIIKENKLWARHDKYKGESRRGLVIAENIYLHLQEEVKELERGLEENDKANVMEEIADVINCAEILAMCIND